MTTPIQKLEKIVDNWMDNGKRYKKLTPYEMNVLYDAWVYLRNDDSFETFISAVAEVCKGLGFKVKLDERGVNYEISL